MRSSPITRNFLAPASKTVFTKSSEAKNNWHALVAKDEYFSGVIGKIGLVLVAADMTTWIVESE